MKKNLILFSLSFFFGFSHLQADPEIFSQEPQQQIVIQNRILAKVNNKTLSVLDVVKKMEVLFDRHYPQYAHSIMAKYQYFSAHWKEMLLQMIDHELILADAEKLDLKITDSEVRESLHERFGPNVMGTLDKLHLSYEEAKNMIYSDIAVQKMTWFKVHAKALNSVNVQDIKNAYASYCEKNPSKEVLEYQVLSIKAQNEEIAYQIAQKACELCKLSPAEISSIPEKLAQNTEEPSPQKDFTITLSEDLKLDAKSISNAHKEVLFKLAKNSISSPVKQQSKADQSTVFRIFYLKDRTKTILPTLRAMYENLHNQLVQDASEKESKIYISKLRQRYGFDTKMLEETIPSAFQPFALQ